MSHALPFRPDFHIRLPATSANLGPGFDTLAVALNLHLEIAASPAATFSIAAQGRNAETCGKLERNLIFETYRRILLDQGRNVQHLHLDVNNEIPLGMGCGSSAAARLAGIALAVEFGGLEWQEDEILAAATYLEGHPDNVTACWLGGMTVATVCRPDQKNDGMGWGIGDRGQNSFPRLRRARFEVPAQWNAIIIVPRVPMQTEESRKALPESYSRPDVVENLQRCGLLVAAFATGQGDLLRVATQDTLHQPYRSSICPLLGKLLPLAEVPGVLGVVLSGAGPGVLLIVEKNIDCDRLNLNVRQALGELSSSEILHCGFASTGAQRMHGRFPRLPHECC